MESNGVFSGMDGMLGLEMSLQQQQQHHLPSTQNPNRLQHQQMVAFGQQEADHHHPQNQQTVAKQGYPFAAKSRTQQLTFSDDDEGAGVTHEDSATVLVDDGNKKLVSPWQRMKWTDGMVKLLIMVVFYIGDDQVGSEGNDPAGKKKGGGGVGLLQKKGKWKSVSRAMMERGFYVSPQQCEDKFNDLNKRYKRVNDILGKGTACKVVENQSLLETMNHLSPKMKEEVKKLLNSKHLYFREMCAYHSSCGGSNANGGGAQQSGDTVAADLAQNQHQHQKRCLHSIENGLNGPNSRHLTKAESEGSKMMIKGGCGGEEDDDYVDEDDEDEDDDEVGKGGSGGHEYDSDDHPSLKKKQRKGMFGLTSPMVQEFSNELKDIEQDMTKSPWEKKQWMRVRLMQLEDQRMKYECQAFELEKQRIKWLTYSSKKVREMEVEKLGNQRMRLENERMVLLLRQKELEFLEFQQKSQSSNKRGDPSSITA